MNLPDDPDARALLYVQQYLEEQGFSDALSALERKAGVLYHSDKCPTGSRLLQLVYQELEAELADSADPLEAAREQEEHQLLQGGKDDYPRNKSATLSGQHTANILAVRFLAGGHQVVTGSADGAVRCFSLPSHMLTWCTQFNGSGGVISLAQQPGRTHSTQPSQPQLPQEACPASPSNGNNSSSHGQCPEAHHNGSNSQPSSSSNGSQPPPLLAAGCMGGTIHLLDSATGQLLASCQPHQKYVVNLAWSSLGQHLVTASFDHTLTIHRVLNHDHHQQQQGARQGDQPGSRATGGDGSSAPTPSVDAGGGGGSGLSASRGPAAGVHLELVRQIPFSSNVQDVLFLPPGLGPAPTAATSSTTAAAAGIAPAPATATAAAAAAEGVSTAPAPVGGSCLLAAVRGANCLYAFSSSSGQEVGQVLLDEERGGPVPYSVIQMALSPDNRYLLLATDGPRLVVLRTRDWSQLRMIHGVTQEQFHTPAVCWARDSNYLFASAAGASIMVFHVGSAKQVAKISGHHSVNVRDIDVDPASNTLVSCSFDKTLVFYT